MYLFVGTSATLKGSVQTLACIQTSSADLQTSVADEYVRLYAPCESLNMSGQDTTSTKIISTTSRGIILLTASIETKANKKYFNTGQFII